MSKKSVLIAALLLLTSQGQGAEAKEVARNGPAASATVHIDNFTFTPAEISVPAGSSITWINGDDIPHAVAATENAFHSKVLDTDQQYSFTFTKPGTYKYFCALHPHMQGKVIVK